MVRSRDAWSAFPRRLRHFPLDLTVVLAFVVATNVAVLAPAVRETPLRAVCALVFVLFVPGYAVTAVAFPRRSASASTDHPDSTSSPRRDSVGGAGVTGIERFVLSLGASLVVVPSVALALNFTPWGVNPLPVLVALSVLTVSMTAAAAVRRRALPAEARFRVPIRRWFRNVEAERLTPGSRSEAIRVGVLTLALILAVSSAAYAVTTPDPGEPHSEFYLLSENGDGALVADDYPENLTTNESSSLVMGVSNQENHPQRYTVVVELQRTASTDAGLRVTEAETLGRYETARLADDETWQRPHQVRPTMTGDRLRLTYMLYRGDAPADPTVENAYRELNLWVTVADEGERPVVTTRSRAT